MTSQMIEEKWYERDFLLWVLDAAPNFLIEQLFMEQNYKTFKKGMKDKTMTSPLRKQRMMTLSKKNLPFKISHAVKDELVVVFDWYYAASNDDKQLNKEEKIAAIHQRYKDHKGEAVQELALALFLNKDFAGAYALYEQYAVTTTEEVASDTTTECQQLQQQLDACKQRLKKYEKLEKENKALKKDKERLTKERVEANAEVRKAKKSEDEKRKDNFALCEKVKQLEATIASSEEAWEADKQARVAAVGERDSLQRDVRELEKERDALNEELYNLRKREQEYEEALAVSVDVQTQDMPIRENLAEQLAKQMQENQLGTPTQKFTFIADEPRVTAEALTTTVLDKPRTGHMAILGDPKGALHSLSDAQKANIEIYDTAEMAQFIADVDHYKLAVVFELRCERQAFERAATAEAVAAVTFVKTVLELVQLMGER